jgi:hypothetical protein
MTMLSNLKIGVKILGGFILAVAATIIVGWMAIGNLRTVENRGTMLYEERAIPLALVGEIASNFQRFE